MSEDKKHIFCPLQYKVKEKLTEEPDDTLGDK